MKKRLFISAVTAATVILGACPVMADDALMVYSPQGGEERGEWIKAHAEEALGFEVNFLAGKGSELSDRLIAEAGNPQADIIMGLVQTGMYDLKSKDLLEPYTPSWAEGLPEVYHDKDGYFYEFWQTPIVFGYNPDYVEEKPTSWQDLIKDEYAGKYAIGDTSAQTVRSYLIGMLWPYYDAETGEISEDGWDFVTTLYENAYELPSDDPSDTWSLFKDGTAPITLNWFGGAKAKVAEYEVNIEYVTPEEGTPIVAEGIGIVKGTDQLEKAQQFEDWWGDPETMAAYANEFGQAPAHPEAIALCNDEVKADAEMFKAQEIDWEVAAQKSGEWFEKIELEIMP